MNEDLYIDDIELPLSSEKHKLKLKFWLTFGVTFILVGAVFYFTLSMLVASLMDIALKALGVK